MPASPKRRRSKGRLKRRGHLSSLRPYVGPRASNVRIGRTTLTVTLDDGRVLGVPLETLPGLAAAPASARRVFELLGGGIGIHFPLCDEDISVANLLHPELTMHYRRPASVRTRSS
jgi:hypothetical protein